jgi:hypothetical protein
MTPLLLREPLRKVGDKVFDMPSQQIVVILDVSVAEDPSDVEWAYVTYLVDAPHDPTGDGAFTDGWRNYYEVCDPDKTLPLDY